MSGSSIFETAWINLVFEGKNKEYGAYQLRRENSKTTLKALFIGLCLFTGLALLPYLLSSFGKAPNTPIENVITLENKEVLFIEPAKPETPKANPATPPVDIRKPDQPTINDNPIVTDLPHETPNLGTGVNTAPPSNPGTPGTGVPGTETPGGGGDSPSIAAPVILNNTPHSVVDKMPEYPGGINKFRKYIADNFKAPDAEESGNDAVKILVSFVVEKDGSISDIKILHNPGYGMDKEAIRVLKSMKTKWSPGLIAGQPVRTIYNLPIAIQPQQ